MINGCLAGLQALLALIVLPISVAFVAAGDGQAWWALGASAAYLLYFGGSLLLGKRPDWFL